MSRWLHRARPHIAYCASRSHHGFADHALVCSQHYWAVDYRWSTNQAVELVRYSRSIDLRARAEVTKPGLRLYLDGSAMATSPLLEITFAQRSWAKGPNSQSTCWWTAVSVVEDVPSYLHKSHDFDPESTTYNWPLAETDSSALPAGAGLTQQAPAY